MWKNEKEMNRGKATMHLLVSIGEIIDAIREAVALLERGKSSEGMAQLTAAIENVREEIANWEAASGDTPLPRQELVGELRAVLEDLLAARKTLEAVTRSGS